MKKINQKRCRKLLILSMLSLIIVSVIIKTQFSYGNIDVSVEYEEKQKVWTYGGGGMDSDISSNGSYIVAGSLNNTILFNKASSTPLWTHQGDGRIGKTVISANGAKMASTHWYQFENKYKVYYYGKGSSVPIWTFSSDALVDSLKISEDGEYVIAENGSHLFLFNSSSSTPLWNFTVTGSISNIAISADGFYIVITVGTGEKKVHLFNRLSNVTLWTYVGINTFGYVDISSSGNEIVANDWKVQNGIIYFFNKGSNVPVWSYAASKYVKDLAISNDGSSITAGISVSPNLLLFNSGSSTPIYDIDVSVPMTNIRDLDINSNGQYFTVAVGNLLSFFHNSSSIPLWSVNVDQTDINKCTLSSDGNYIVVSTSGGSLYLYDKTVPSVVSNGSELPNGDTPSISFGSYFIMISLLGIGIIIKSFKGKIKNR